MTTEVISAGAWIASGVITIGPSRIGEDAVVSAGSVVKGDVEPLSIVAGNPAVLIGRVHAKSQAETHAIALLRPPRPAMIECTWA